MIKLNSVKCGLGLVASLALGLSGCFMDQQRSQQETHMVRGQQATTAPAHKAENTKASTNTAAGKREAGSSSRKPVQQEAPGPKRAAAPQLPVIQ